MGQRKRDGLDIHNVIVTGHKHYASPEEFLEQVGFNIALQHVSESKDKDKLELDEVRQELASIKDCKDVHSLKRLFMAFVALFCYAMNLFTCPWKREFRTIKTYGGYYNIHVKSVLKDPITIFNLMGYVEKGDVLELEGSVNKERILDVAVCCLIASCEVRVVSDVYVGLDEKYSISDILECRRRNVGSVKDCVSLVRGNFSREPETDRRNEVVSRRFRKDVSDSSGACERYKDPVGGRGLSKEGVSTRSTGRSGLSSNRVISLLTDELPLEPMVSKSSHDSDLPKTVVNLDESAEEDLYQPASHDKHVEQSMQVLESESTSAKDVEFDDKGSFQDWSIVYDTLGKDYYTGDRGDITAHLAPQITTVKTKPVKVLRMRELPREVVVDGGSSAPKPLPRDVAVGGSPASEHEQDRLKVDVAATDGNDGVWNCPKCTSINVPSAVVCSVCSSSRRGHTRTLPSGGPECPQCTLVNEIGVKECEACGSPLVGSPTYI